LSQPLVVGPDHDLDELHQVGRRCPAKHLPGALVADDPEHPLSELPDCDVFARAVAQREAKLRLEAATRQELDDARRRVVEQILLDYGLLEYRGNKLPFFAAGTRT